jgi:hypothetical protein
MHSGRLEMLHSLLPSKMTLFVCCVQQVKSRVLVFGEGGAPGPVLISFSLISSSSFFSLPFLLPSLPLFLSSSLPLFLSSSLPLFLSSSFLSSFHSHFYILTRVSKLTTTLGLSGACQDRATIHCWARAARVPQPVGARDAGPSDGRVGLPRRRP